MSPTIGWLSMIGRRSPGNPDEMQLDQPVPQIVQEELAPGIPLEDEQAVLVPHLVDLHDDARDPIVERLRDLERDAREARFEVQPVRTGPERRPARRYRWEATQICRRGRR